MALRSLSFLGDFFCLREIKCSFEQKSKTSILPTGLTPCSSSSLTLEEEEYERTYVRTVSGSFFSSSSNLDVILGGVCCLKFKASS